MNLKLKSLTKSLWVFHFASAPCNNCDIEILDALTPKYDLERFGILLVGSIRHADVLLVTGMITHKGAERLKRLYEQAPKPRLVVAVGSCACSKSIFKDSYNAAGPVDRIVPVSAYIPGCPPKPEAMIMGVVKLVKSLTGK
ncbi:MAG: NADH-quinone oxidoreductase subunit B family protein [Actinobacteria bacterium]|jgi:Ni,Fe-hydrogenase III small subunit|nr:NADH-quinone oxidoreductase subunit B family protein [Actinomycetota bacterium]